MISFNSSGNVMNIAHRGASSYAPENTLLAFQKAIDLGANYLELDLHLSKDGHMVVIHDNTVNRTTNGTGKISELNLIELKELDAGSHKGIQFKGEKVPELKEVFDLVQNDEIKLIIEVKKGSGIEEKLISLIINYQLQNRVILKSFDLEVLQKLKKLAPDIPQLLVYVTNFSFIDLVVGARPYFFALENWSGLYLQEHQFFVNQKDIENIHNRGHKLIAWGVNSLERMDKLIEMGVDGIETDYPDLLNQRLSLHAR